MGARKTGFMRGDHYGIRVAAWHVAELLAKLHSKAASFEGISTEARDNDTWDDLVIDKRDETVRWQIKRQTTPLASDKLKDIIVDAKAVLAQNNESKFRIAFRELESVHFPQPKVKGKKTKPKDLELSHLQQLCVEAAAPGMQAAALIADTSVPYSCWWPELQDWLGTSDPGALQEMTKRIEIVCLGDEAQLDAQGVNWLTPFYEHPDEVLESLVRFFTDYPDGRIKVTPQLLAQSVLAAHVPRTGSAIWFDLGLNDTGTRWELRSVRPLKDIARQSWIELSAVELTLSSSPVRREDVTSQLTRLALHSNTSTTIRAVSSTEWAAHASQSCAGTLGTDQNLCAIASGGPGVVHMSPLETFLPQELADRLSSEMNALVWAALTKTVVARANSLSIEPTLRAAMLKRWETWYGRMNQDAGLRLEFTARLLATEAELTQPEFDSRVRSGPAIVAHGADACLLALAVAEAFQPGAVDVAPSISSVSGNLKMGGVDAHVIAVSRALDRRDRGVCSLSSDPYAALSVEPGIVLLGGISQEAAQLRRFWEDDASRFSDDGSGAALDKSGSVPLIPFSDSLKRALRDGLPALQKHLADVLAPIVDDEYAALKDAIAGATA